MSLEHALNLLNSKSIWFSSPEMWHDPYEKKFIDAFYDSTDRFAWKGRVFCSCFTDNATSEASWNAYSNNPDCIQFTFHRKALFNVLEACQNDNPKNKVYFDKVEYMQTKDIESPLSKIPFDPKVSDKVRIKSTEIKVRLLMLKRKAFEYEKEYRAIIVKPKITKEHGIKVSIPDIHALIAKITIGPKVEEDTFKMLKEMLIDKYYFNSNDIRQSFLYKSLPKVIMIKTE